MSRIVGEFYAHVQTNLRLTAKATAVQSIGKHHFGKWQPALLQLQLHWVTKWV